MNNVSIFIDSRVFNVGEGVDVILKIFKELIELSREKHISDTNYYSNQSVFIHHQICLEGIFKYYQQNKVSKVKVLIMHYALAPVM